MLLLRVNMLELNKFNAVVEGLVTLVFLSSHRICDLRCNNEVIGDVFKVRIFFGFVRFEISMDHLIDDIMDETRDSREYIVTIKDYLEWLINIFQNYENTAKLTKFIDRELLIMDPESYGLLDCLKNKRDKSSTKSLKKLFQIKREVRNYLLNNKECEFYQLTIREIGKN